MAQGCVTTVSWHDVWSGVIVRVQEGKTSTGCPRAGSLCRAAVSQHIPLTTTTHPWGKCYQCTMLPNMFQHSSRPKTLPNINVPHLHTVCTPSTHTHTDTHTNTDFRQIHKHTWIQKHADAQFYMPPHTQKYLSLLTNISAHPHHIHIKTLGFLTSRGECS